MDILIRQAMGEDKAGIVACVRAAYAKSVPRIGKEPAPMRADYATLIAHGAVYVISVGTEVRGVVVCFARDDHVFLENIAISPAYQGQGLGRALMQFVEQRAQMAGLDEIRLYTHERMTENLTYYPNLGYTEFDRRTEDGYQRVYMRKFLETESP